MNKPHYITTDGGVWRLPRRNYLRMLDMVSKGQGWKVDLDALGTYLGEPENFSDILEAGKP
jgi:hypothetical protein